MKKKKGEYKKTFQNTLILLFFGTSIYILTKNDIGIMRNVFIDGLIRDLQIITVIFTLLLFYGRSVLFDWLIGKTSNTYAQTFIKFMSLLVAAPIFIRYSTFFTDIDKSYHKEEDQKKYYIKIKEETIEKYKPTLDISEMLEEFRRGSGHSESSTDEENIIDYQSILDRLQK